MNRSNPFDETGQLRRKADRQWELAGLARQDGDHEAELHHTENAREYQRQLGELLRAQDSKG